MTFEKSIYGQKKLAMASLLAALRPLSSLCILAKDACIALSPMILAIYANLGNESFMKLKSDSSAFTVADGIVQNLLCDYLFKGKFSCIVGEEDDSKVNLLTKPYFVDDIIVPTSFDDVIDTAKANIIEISRKIDSSQYLDLTAFVDPIDGTKEFSSGFLTKMKQLLKDNISS